MIAQGFIPGEAEALMVLDLEKVPAALLRPITHDVQRITDPDKLAEIVRVQNQVWGEDHSWLAAKLAKELLNPQGSVYVAYASGEPASCAWIRFSEKGQFASLWGGATIPAHRKQGFYTALVAARTQEARRRGARFLTIDAGPMSRPIVEKFGFQLLTHTYPCDWKVKQPKLLS
ncbi:GNAT family N-acetyltransferase [Candidatus Acetothermia bacterium]|nr:GNAT family N-acetyltransferase [Candidatus Acetothermia bacterium]